MLKLSLVTAAATALLMPVPAQAVTTLISENFESGFGVFAASGQVGINAGADYIPCCGVTGSAASLANHFASFGSGDLPSGTLTSPIFDFIPGETYTLDLDFAELGSGTENLTIELGPGITVTISNAANNNLDTTFSPIHLPITLSAFGSVMSGPVRIYSAGASSVDTVIDNFVLTTTADVPGAPSVPEPASWAMLLLGFGAVGIALRRSRLSLKGHVPIYSGPLRPAS